MPIIEIIYITFVALAIIACVPQLRRLGREKQSQELALNSWAVWLAAQVATTAYVWSIGAYLMALVNITWVSFYAAMVGLILYYRRYPGGRVAARVSVESA